MTLEQILGLALEQGIVSGEQADRMRALAELQAPAEPADDEKLRFITGFGDIFVTIGLALFLGSVGYFVVEAAGITTMAAVIAAAAWGLAEFFTRRRRMALPSIVLLLTFAAAVFLLGSGATWFSLDWGSPRVLLGAAVLTAVAVAVHYLRFRVPITVAVGVAAIVVAVLGLWLLVAPAVSLAHLDALLLACGLAVFALAMRFDMTDPHRLTRRTDIAFWLHLLAAPLIVHPLIGGFIWRGGTFDAARAAAVLAAFLGLGVIAVLVDRRAILVSGLTNAGFASATLLRQSSLADKTVPATLLALGAFVLLLSAGWRPLRSAILSVLPASVTRRLPNPVILRAS